jgi:predicted porin
LKAIFALEAFFRPDTGEQGRTAADPLFSRNAWVGFESELGRLTLGRQTNPTYAVMSQLSPFGNSVVFSPLTVQNFVPAYGRNIIGDSVWNNAIQYATPDLRGFRGSVLYGFGEIPDDTSKSNFGVHGNYRNGKFLGAASFQRVRVNVNTPLSDAQKAWLAGAAYDFGPVKVFGNLAGTSMDGGNSARQYDAGISVPVGGAGTVMLEGARSLIDVANAPDRHRTTASVGYDYRLSKRTDLYAIYTYDKRDDASSGDTKALGIRHTF